jgi:hypothetical protein
LRIDERLVAVDTGRRQDRKRPTRLGVRWSSRRSIVVNSWLLPASGSSPATRSRASMRASRAMCNWDS